MEKLLDTILKSFIWVLQHFGVFGLTVYVLLLILLIIVVVFAVRPKAFKNFSDLWKEWRIRKKRKHLKITKEKIKKHKIFIKKLKYEFDITRIDFRKEYYKTKIVQLAIDTELDTDIQQLKHFLNTDDLYTVNKIKLQYLMGECVKDMTELFNSVMELKIKKFTKTQIEAFNKKHTTEQMEIFTDQLFHYFMYEAGGYDEKRTERLGDVYIDIENIPNSPLYNTNYERIYRFFDIIDRVIEKIINNAIEDFREFNGHIDKKFHKFIIEGKVI